MMSTSNNTPYQPAAVLTWRLQGSMLLFAVDTAAGVALRAQVAMLASFQNCCFPALQEASFFIPVYDFRHGIRQQYY
jgi:hypothetical protein